MPRTGKSTNGSFLLDFSHLKPKTQAHVRNVYMTMTGLMAASVAGVYAYDIHRDDPSAVLIGSFVGALLCIISVLASSNTPIRYISLVLFGIFKGVLVGPLIEHVDDAEMVIGALLASCTIFALLSASVLISPNRKYVYLSGMLFSGIVICFYGTILNVFFQSDAADTALIGIGLFVFAGYVLYDTQIMIENASNEIYDVPTDVINLYTNLFAIFVRILRIMSKKKSKK